MSNEKQADVKVVELKQEMFDLKNEYDLQVITSIDFIEKLYALLTARLTAQAAEHDRVIKELEKKVIEAIPKGSFYKDGTLESKIYWEAIAEITQSIKSAFGGAK